MSKKRAIVPDIVATNFEKHVKDLNWNVNLTNKIREGQVNMIRWVAYRASRVYLNGISEEGEEWLPLYACNQDWTRLSKGTISEKTAYNRLLRLQEAGLIRKRFRGRTNPYELLIPKWILLAKPCPTDFLKDQKTAFSLILAPPEENLPPKSTRTGGNTNSAVDTCVSEGEEDIRHLPGLAAPAHEQQEQPRNMGAGTREASPLLANPQTFLEENFPQERQEQRLRGAGGGPAGALDDKGSKQPEPGTSPSTEGNETPQRLATGKASSGSGPAPKKYLTYVVLLWEFAKKTLYQGRAFSLDEERRAKNTIYWHVFASFKPAGEEWTDQEWHEYFHNCQDRITLAWQYVNRSPERFVPHPVKYFDSQFAHGFVRTHQWLLRTKLLKHQYHVSLELQKARASMEAGRAPKGLKGATTMSRLQLYQYWHTRISKLRDEDALRAFFAYCTQVGDQPEPGTGASVVDSHSPTQNSATA